MYEKCKVRTPYAKKQWLAYALLSCDSFLRSAYDSSCFVTYAVQKLYASNLFARNVANNALETI